MPERKNVDVSFDNKLEVNSDSFAWYLFAVFFAVFAIFGPIRGCSTEGTKDLFRQNHKACEQLCSRANHGGACYTHCMKEYRFESRLP